MDESQFFLSLGFFLDWNMIVSFLHPDVLLPHLLSFKFMLSFSLPLGTRMHGGGVRVWGMWGGWYILKYIKTAWSVHIMLLVCVFSGLTIWYWITSWCTLPWGRLFLQLSAALVVCSFSTHSGLRTHEISPLSCQHVQSSLQRWENKHLEYLSHSKTLIRDTAALLSGRLLSCRGGHPCVLGTCLALSVLD